MQALLSRGRLFLAALVLLLAALFVPAPAALFPTDAAGLSGVKLLGDDLLSGAGGSSWRWVVGETIVWSRTQMGFWHVAALSLAFFANVVFLVAFLRHDATSPSLAARAFFAAAVAAGVAVAGFFPVFLRVPGYWFWLAALAALAWGFIGFDVAPRSAARSSVFSAGDGDIPLVVWMWLAFLVFWLTVTWLGDVRGTADSLAEAPPSMPGAKPLSTYVTDEARLLDPADAAKLTARLAAFEKETSTQVAVATYPRSPPGAIEEFTIAVAERSRLGGKGKDNGAILFVFKEGRSARLEVGYGLEGVLTDAGSHRLLEERLMPAFARGDYTGGIAQAVDAVLLAVKDAYTQGRMPSALDVLWQQVRAASPKLVHQAFPALVGLGFLPRFLVSFFAGVFATIGCYVAREVVRNAYYFARMASGKKVERISFDAMLEKLKLLGFALEVVVFSSGFALAAVAAVAGIVIVAAGGGFGGAGAAIRW